MGKSPLSPFDQEHFLDIGNTRKNKILEKSLPSEN